MAGCLLPPPPSGLKFHRVHVSLGKLKSRDMSSDWHGADRCLRPYLLHASLQCGPLDSYFPAEKPRHLDSRNSRATRKELHGGIAWLELKQQHTPLALQVQGLTKSRPIICEFFAMLQKQMCPTLSPAGKVRLLLGLGLKRLYKLSSPAHAATVPRSPP